MRKRGLSVLLVAPLPPPEGGIASWTRLVIGKLDDPGVEIRQVDTAVHWREVNNRSLIPRLVGGALQSSRDILKTVAQTFSPKPDVLHLCTSAGVSLVRDCAILGWCRAAGVPSVIHFHFGRLPRVKDLGNWEWNLARRAARLATRTVVLDRASFAVLNVETPGKVVRLPNFVDITEIEGQRAQSKRAAGIVKLLYVGHVLPSKGVTDLVEACAAVGKKAELTLEIVGPVSGRYRTELEALATMQPGRPGWVTFTGSVGHDEALRKIHGCDVLCLPSRSEGFPITVLEAMAAGKAVLATDVGAIAEVLDVGGSEPCGVCVRAGDRNALGAAIVSLAANAQLRIRFGSAGASRCRSEYSATTVLPRLRKLWADTAMPLEKEAAG